MENEEVLDTTAPVEAEEVTPAEVEVESPELDADELAPEVTE